MEEHRLCLPAFVCIYMRLLVYSCFLLLGNKVRNTHRYECDLYFINCSNRTRVHKVQYRRNQRIGFPGKDGLVALG